jgi:uncharacterized membrane protein
VIGQQPRFALEEPLFPFPALAAAAGRATLGGPREITLACLMAARMAALLLKPFDTPSEAHRERADKARHWVGTLSLPAAIRNAALKAVEATGTGDVDLTGAALDRLLAVAAATLDPASRDELSRLAERLSRAAETSAAMAAGPAAAQNELQPG